MAIDPFPGKPTTYLYIDPNDSTKFTVDPNASGPQFRLSQSPTGIYGYQSGVVDTTQQGSVSPGAQQLAVMKMKNADGTTVSSPATFAAPKYKHQLEQPSVGGYFNSTDTANP